MSWNWTIQTLRHFQYKADLPVFLQGVLSRRGSGLPSSLIQPKSGHQLAPSFWSNQSINFLNRSCALSFRSLVPSKLTVHTIACPCHWLVRAIFWAMDGILRFALHHDHGCPVFHFSYSLPPAVLAFFDAIRMPLSVMLCHHFHLILPPPVTPPKNAFSLEPLTSPFGWKWKLKKKIPY